jgi:diacylglycerol kinase family enzyme
MLPILLGSPDPTSLPGGRDHGLPCSPGLGEDATIGRGEMDVKSVPLGRRVSAVVALLAPLAVLVVLVVVLIRRPLVLVGAALCFSLGVAAAAYAVTRPGIRRTLALVLAVLALAGSLVLLIAAAGGLVALLVVVALIVVGGGATKHALGRDIKSLKSSPTPGTAVGPAARPVLLMNPRSGGGKVERFNLVEEARRRGIEPVVLQPGDDLLRLAEQAVAGGADVVGMAGGDGSQALVAGVAARHDVGFVCVPAGTRNHLAMDLGLDRDDVVGALDAFGEAVERRIDLGMVGDRVFVNNATVGLYAKIVQSPAYRDHKVGTALELLPAMLGPGATPFDLRFTGPDGTEHDTVHLVLVSNDRYELGSGEGFGSRRRIDGGNLGIVAATFRNSGEIARLVESGAAGRSWRPPGWVEWADARFELRSGQPVEIGIDGEALVLDPPIRFRTLPGALRVRIPRGAPGYSPAAAAPTRGWATVTALLQATAGRPVAIGA